MGVLVIRPVAKKTVKIGDVVVGEDTVICGCVSERDVFEMIEVAEEAGSADLVELRLDALDDPDVTDVKRQLSNNDVSCPIILTIRKENEGGDYHGNEAGRAELFEELIEFVDAIDLEYHTADKYRREIVQKAKEVGDPIIFSYHNYSRTGGLEEFKFRLEECLELGDIAKVATMIQSPKDSLNLLKATYEVKKRLKEPLVSVGMGGLGKHTRVVAPFYGSDIVYASVDEATAPGQLSVGEVKDVLDLLEKSTAPP